MSLSSALVAVLVVVSAAAAQDEVMSGSEDMHLTMEDLMNQLNGDAAPEAEPDYDPTVGGSGPASGEGEEPVVVPWGEVYGEVSVTTPANGSVVEGAVVEVAVNINANTEDTDMFKEKYNASVLCLSLDGSVFSCWPIWELSRYPRFANVSEGNHTVVAQITDPATGKLDVEHQGISTFTTVPKPPTPPPPPPPPPVLNEDGTTNTTNSTEPVQETISLPMVTVDQPAEGSAMRSNFEVRLSITTSENVTKFKRLFKYSFMCLSVDDGPHTCWPIFEDRYFPSFVGLAAGMHRITSELSHPESGEIILGTGVGFRRFWVQEAGESLMPLQLSEPGSEFASNAIPGLEEKQARPQAQVVVQVAVDGFTHSLPIYAGDDWESEARRFCVASRLGDQCVANIVAEIEVLWEARQHNQHLDFTTDQVASEVVSEGGDEAAEEA